MSKVLTKVFLILGLVFLLSSIALLIYSRVLIPANESSAASIVSEFYSLIPSISKSYPEEKIDITMPCVELEGVDFSGVISIPLYDTELPVCNLWNSVSINKYPHRFTGSVYDSTLIIGGSDNIGQFDFMKNISLGDYVTFTDALGKRYTYTVSDINIVDDVSFETLSCFESDLTFFARDSYGLDYTVVICKLK